MNDVRSGLRTYSEDYSERGLEWKDQLRQRATEAKYLAELAAEFGISADSIATFNPNPAPVTAGQTAEPLTPPQAQ